MENTDRIKKRTKKNKNEFVGRKLLNEKGNYKL